MTMTFGDAINALKEGYMVARRGWNGKGMYLRLVRNGNYAVGFKQGEPLADHISLAPWIGMKTATNEFVPWLASQSDMLSEDWEIVI